MPEQFDKQIFMLIPPSLLLLVCLCLQQAYAINTDMKNIQLKPTLLQLQENNWRLHGDENLTLFPELRTMTACSLTLQLSRLFNTTAKLS